MPLRLLEMVVPVQEKESANNMLEKHGITRSWHLCSPQGDLYVKWLVPAEKTEALLNDLSARYGSYKKFHLTILPVEAVLPKWEENEKEEIIYIDKPPPKPPSRVATAEILSDASDMAGLTRVFCVMVILSSVVAAIGLIKDSAAVVIGAMVIAPLLGPNVSLALSTTLADKALAQKALTSFFTGVALATVIAVILGRFLPMDPGLPEIASRTGVSFGDLALALASGVAGTLALTQALPSALIGVMVAVALLPPLVTAGLLLGSGHFALARGAFLLFSANVICVNLAGVGTFLALGVRPRALWEKDRAKRATIRSGLLWALLFCLLIIIIHYSKI